MLRVLLLSDGVPGHYRQGEAVAAALGRRREIGVDRVELHTRAPRALLPRLARILPARAFLRAAHGIVPDALPACDLIVSAGAATLEANAALAAALGLPNIFAGSLRGLPSAAVTLVLSPYPSAEGRPNHLVALKPSLTDPDLLPEPRPWSGPAAARGMSLGLLIGGPTREVAFAAADWLRLASLIATTSSAWGAGWRIATSRRTPRAAYDALQAVSERPDVELLDFRRTGVGSAERALAADAVLVTLDSLSMISEAVAARRPAIALAPKTVRRSRDAEAVEALAAAGRLRVLPLAGASPETLDGVLRALSPMRANHLDALAEAILARVAL